MNHSLEYTAVVYGPNDEYAKNAVVNIVDDNCVNDTQTDQSGNLKLSGVCEGESPEFRIDLHYLGKHYRKNVGLTVDGRTDEIHLGEDDRFEPETTKSRHSLTESTPTDRSMEPPPRSGMSVTTIFLIGAAVAGGIAGGMLVAAEIPETKFNNRYACGKDKPNHGSQECDGLYDDITMLQHGAGVAAISGLVLLGGAGVTYLLTDGRVEAQSSASCGMSPLGVTCVGHF